MTKNDDYRNISEGVHLLDVERSDNEERSRLKADSIEFVSVKLKPSEIPKEQSDIRVQDNIMGNILEVDDEMIDEYKMRFEEGLEDGLKLGKRKMLIITLNIQLHYYKTLNDSKKALKEEYLSDDEDIEIIDSITEEEVKEYTPNKRFKTE